MPKVELECDVLSVEENTYKGNVYRNAVVRVDGVILQFGLAEGVQLEEGKEQVLVIGFRKFGSDIKAQSQVVGVGK